MNITTATPAQIDTQLARLAGEDEVIGRVLQFALQDGRRLTGEEPIGRGSRRRYRSTTTEVVEELRRLLSAGELTSYRARNAIRVVETIEKALEDLAAIEAQRKPLENEYKRRGGWTRAFLCTNSNGHVHKSTSCRTLHIGTRINWVITVDVDGAEVEVSGMTEEQVIELAGEGACTVCYPDAPVTDRPSRIFDRESAVEKAARDAERAAKAKAKAAKGITNPDGTELRVKLHGYAETIKTEVTAEREAVNILFNAKLYDSAIEEAPLGQILEALAAKRGTDVADQRALVEKKAAAKYRRETR